MKKFLFCTTLIAACLASSIRAASVGPAGYFTDFPAQPPASDWATLNITGAAGDITNSVQMDTAVAALAASGITARCASSNANPPNAVAAAVWSTTGYMQTRATANRYCALMATLVNATGSNVTSANISYSFVTNLLVAEQVLGQRAYYSLTGLASSWVNIPEFSSAASGTLSASLSIAWNDGSPLYLLFTDDNGSGTPDTACQIDDFSVTTGGGSASGGFVNLTAPADGASFVAGITFAVNGLASGSVTDMGFYLDGLLFGSDITVPFGITFSNIALGPHLLTAVGNSSATSAPVNITIVPNNPPSVALVTTSGSNTLVGLNITNTATITDLDPGGSIQRVEFYLDGALRFTDTTSPYTYELCDITAGPHVVMAVAIDQGSARGTNSNSLTATNPTDVTVLIPNGSTWKYLDKGSNGSTNTPSWESPLFDDTGWSNGVAELGYGDSGNNRPETTLVGFGPSGTAKYITTYFRKTFTVTDPAAYTNLIVRLLRDDGGVAYLNGVEVFRSFMTNGAFTFTTLAGLAGAGPAAGDDGTVYQSKTNASTLVAGPNVIAVEIHQDTAGSSDISFDLMLWGQGPAGPVLTITPADATHADVSWLISGSAGYVLETKDDLNNAWGLAADLDVPDATRHHVNVDTSTANRFFRLNKP